MKTLLLIDLSHIFRSAWHASADQAMSVAFERTLEKVHGLASGYELVAVCCDHPPYKRSEVHPAYKANREKQPDAMFEQFRRVKARLEADGFLLWSVPGFEADDVIATAVGYAQREETPLDVTIATNDKDLMQLVDDDAHVRILSTATGDAYDQAGVITKFGVHPAQLIDALALQGDSSDNVPGIPKVGVKTAAKLVSEFGDVEEVIAAALAGRVAPPNLCKAIVEHAAAVRLARRVIALNDDVPLEWDQVFVKREPKPLADGPADAGFDDDPDVAALDAATGSTGATGATGSSPRAARPPSSPPPPAEGFETTTALAKTTQAAPLAIDNGLQPQSIEAAWKLSGALYSSRLYARFPTRESIFAVIIRGREMGLQAMTSLDMFHIVEGKPSPHAHLLIAQAKNHPDCEYFRFLGGDDTYAEYETKSRQNPTPTKLRYTIDQAKRAGVVKTGSNWEKRPAEMLRKTCAVQLARIEYPEALGGLYAIEELAA